MEPYQAASEEMKRQGERPFKFLKSGISSALGFGGAGLALNKVMPFLNKYLPQDLAIKGLSKIDPRFGGFINKALENGETFDNIRNFIGEKAQSAQQEEPEDKRNIIQKYSDKLHAFIEDQVKKGRSPLEAGALAQINPEYKKVINKIERDHKTNWSNILQTIYGGQQQQQQQGQNPPPVSSGTADEALMMALDKILKM